MVCRSLENLYSILFYSILFYSISNLKAQVLPPPCPGAAINVVNLASCDRRMNITGINFNEVAEVEWFILTPSYYRLCEARVGWYNNEVFSFCFNGNYRINAIVHYNDGSTCSVTRSLAVNCSLLPQCNTLSNTLGQLISSIRIAVTDISPCGAFSYVFEPMGYLPIIPYYPNCKELFNYKLVYTSCDGQQCINLDYSRHCFIDIMPSTPFMVIVTGNHCCLPTDYIRYLNGIAPPQGVFQGGEGTYFGQCHQWCSAFVGCNNSQDIWPVDNLVPSIPHNCFTGGGQVVESRTHYDKQVNEINIFDRFDFIEVQNNGKELIQSIHITNIEGKQIQFVDYFGGIQSESKIVYFSQQISSGIFLVVVQTDQRKVIKKVFRN